jgi:hypothetical protein
MKETIEIKIILEEKQPSFEVECSGRFTINNFAYVLEGLKYTWKSSVEKYCEKNRINLDEFVHSTTVKEFAKILNQ